MPQLLVSIDGVNKLIIDRDIAKSIGDIIVFDLEGEQLGRIPNKLNLSDIQIVFLFDFADKSFSKGVIAGMTKKQNEFKRVLGITDK